MAALLGNLTDPDIYYMSAVPLSFPSLEKKIKKKFQIYMRCLTRGQIRSSINRPIVKVDEFK
jgi:hypothetical protein